MLRLAPLFCFFLISGAWAAETGQGPMQTAGAVVIVPASGEVRHPNDEARATFLIEEQDRDRAAAASRVNQKMARGMEIIKRNDPGAMLKTRGYYTYPVYPDEPGLPRQSGKPTRPASWRVGQYLEVITGNLTGLPKTTAAAQGVLALHDLNFGLSAATSKRLEEEGIAAAYQNLTERIAAIAKTMRRNLVDAALETIDFEATGAYAERQDARAAKMLHAARAEMEQVVEPSFEPGETAMTMRVVGKVRFK